jgi:hypothetical protein
MIKLELTMDDANALANLLDLAVKAGGIRVAGAASEFMRRLEEASKEVPEEKKDDN